MVFFSYFFKRYITYFVAITFFLAFLFNVIEFFEKVMRSTHAGLGNIGYFSLLNFFSSLADLMPVGSWLASCLLIREFVQQGEWETLELLTIDFKGLLKNFFYTSIIVMLASCILNETVLRPLAVKAEQFRQVTFKKERTDTLFDAWYKLDATTFCYIQKLDFKEQKGNDLILLTLSENFSLHTIMFIDSFTFNSDERAIFVQQGSRLCLSTLQQEISLVGKTIHLPALFGQLLLKRQQFSLMSLLYYGLFSDVFGVLGIGNELWFLFWERVLMYFQIVFFSLAVLVTFISLEANVYLRWPSIFAVYPAYFILSVTFKSFLEGAGFLWGMLAFYCTVLIVMAFIYRKRHYR